MRPRGTEESPSSWPRLATLLGIVYIVGLSVVLRFVTGTDRPLWLVPVGLLGIALLAAVTYALPDWAVFQSPFRQAYSPRFAGVLRMSYYTALLVVLAHLRWATGGRSAIYPVLLWLVPLGTSFMFFMYLAGRLPALQRRCRPADQLARLLHGPLHPLGGLRLRTGHAHPAPPVSGGSPLSPAPAAPTAEICCMQPIATRSSKRTGLFTTRWVDPRSWTR